MVESRGQAAAAERLQLLFEVDWAVRLELNPELATFTGAPGHHDRWTDRTPAGLDRRRSHPRAARAALLTIDRGTLGPVDQVSYDLFLREAEAAIALQAFPDDLMPITQLGGIQQAAANLFAIAPRDTRADLEDQLRRLTSLPAAIDQVIALLDEGLRRGVTQSRVALRNVPQQVRNQIVGDPLAAPLLVAFRQLPPSLPAEEQQRLRAAAARIYTGDVVPAWRRLERFLEERYLPQARDDVSWRSLPQGAAWYEELVRQRTTTDLTPQQIHEIGRQEVARIRTAMERVKASTGFPGSLEDFFTHLRTDPQFFFSDGPALLRAYRDVAKRADAELPRFFGMLPRTPYGVAAVPAFAEQSQTTAYYRPGSLPAGRPGIFFANTYALATRPRWEIEALTLHEAVPGHHLQIALQQERENLPAFRRFGLELTAYVEGWGLYAESLGDEMGFYRDPYSKFGQLTYEMWRAIRLVVDTGLHALGWSRREAIDYFRLNAGKSENDIVVEIDRYIVWPGQALAYKLGELKLQELRARASRELGTRFDLRLFHDEVLRHGPLPLDLLERQVLAWVETQR